MSPDRILSEFASFAAQPDELITLDHGALLIAKQEYNDLSIKTYIDRLDLFASAVAEQMPSGAKPARQVELLNTFLFIDRGFHGNKENYYDPRNSFLNDVIERRTGIPISLSIIYMEIGRRLKIPLRGVALPGHFVVKYDRPGLDLFIDPFHAGDILKSDDCHELVLRLFGGHVPSFGSFLQPVGTRAILTRMLTNLKVIYIHDEDYDRAIRALDRIILLNPLAIIEFRERGLLHFAASHYRAALSDLSTYLMRYPDCPDADFIHQRIDMIITTLQTQF